MKKLVVMLGVACVALLSQAASIDWSLSASKSNKNYGADGTTVFGKTSGEYLQSKAIKEKVNL